MPPYNEVADSAAVRDDEAQLELDIQQLDGSFNSSIVPLRPTFAPPVDDRPAVRGSEEEEEEEVAVADASTLLREEAEAMMRSRREMASRDEDDAFHSVPTTTAAPPGSFNSNILPLR